MTKPVKMSMQMIAAHNAKMLAPGIYDMIVSDYDINRQTATFQLTNTKGETTMANKGDLYKVVKEEKYGTYLATDKQGRYVLEMKGDNSIAAFAKDEIEEVLPETIGVKFISNNRNQNETTYNYLMPETSIKFELNDLLWLNEYDAFVVVTQINGTSKRATKTFKGYLVARGVQSIG